MFDLNSKEIKLLTSLDSPQKIQKYLDTLPFNFEKNGETCMSPRMVMAENKCHCIEGAMLASVALLLNGNKPLLLNLKVKENDYDHVVALYKINGYWGAISKTNHGVLRYRDPIYRNTRELALSYFNEYFLTSTGQKTLLGYSRIINMNKFGKKWITSSRDLWEIAEYIFDLPYTSIVPKENKNYISNASDLEKKVANIPEW